jgi:biotin carboxylase
MQIPSIRAARELGWRTVVVDGNPQAQGAALADTFLAVDLKDREGLVEAARRVRSESGLDGVFTAGTDFSASVAWVAQALSLPGISYETALRASDKLKMREALAAAGLSSPRFAAASSASDPAIADADLAFPLVVKPADSMGARGCRSVGDQAELAAAIDAALPYSRSARAIVEEYVEGPEFSVDALVLGEDIRIRGIADRHIFFPPYFVELGHTMPSSYPREALDEVLRVFRLGVRALGIDLGAAKGDMKFSPTRGAVVGEIAARLSGGYMSGWTYPYASGIDVTKEALRLCVGLGFEADRGALDRKAEARGFFSAERAFISIPGRVASISGCLEAERLPYVKQLFLRVAPGDRVVFPANNVEKCGNLISQAPTREAAVEAAESGARSVLIRLRPAEPETEAFLAAGAAAPWPPSAFAPQGALARELEAMPEYLEGPGDLVSPFSGARELHGRDWSGRGYAESAELALRLGGGADRPKGSRSLAGRFWRALARGGLQAALYVLDTESLVAAGLSTQGASP